MKNRILLLALLLSPLAMQAQNDLPPVETAPITPPIGEHVDLIHMSTNNYIDLELPPLHVLLANARERSPQVNMFSAKQEGEERELKTIRRSWLRHVKLNSSFSYGTNDMNSDIYYSNQNAVVQNVTGATQRWWNVGASINLPLEEIFNRRNKVKQQQQRVASIQYEVENWYDDVCLKIINSYTQAVFNLSLLESAARSMVSAQTESIAVESDFINGKVNSQVLSRQKTIESDAIRQYEQIRSELNKALLELEVYSKTPILSQNRDIQPQ